MASSAEEAVFVVIQDDPASDDLLEDEVLIKDWSAVPVNVRSFPIVQG
jgi:hypothetical protein